MTLALALLLPSPPPAPEALLGDICTSEWGAAPTFSARAVDPTFPGVQHLEFRVHEATFLAVTSDTPHPDSEDIRSQIPALNQSLVEGHQGWIAVTYLPDGDFAFEDCYPPMAKMIAGIVDALDAATTGAVLHTPQWQRSVPAQAATASTLRGAQPLAQFGVRYTRLGCLVQEDSAWVTVYPSPYGAVRVELLSGSEGPAPATIERVRTALDEQLRLYRARVAFSLTHRPLRLRVEADGVIRVQFRNKFTRLRSRWVTRDSG